MKSFTSQFRSNLLLTKNIFAVFSLLLLLFSCTEKQQVADCCQSPMTQFASLGSDVKFQKAHDAPLASNYVAMGRMINYPTPDGKSARAYYLPAKSESKKFLLVFHEWWGLNDWIRKQADMYADSFPGVNVLALDLYDGKIATTSEEASKLMQSNDQARSQSIVKGAVQYAGEDSKIATIGWCFGGAWSLQGALIANDHTKGCVMYYGMPESDVEKLKKLDSDVLFVFAKKDKFINEQVKNDFVKNMDEADKKLTVKEYDADHAFANPSNPHFDSAATADAQMHTINYLRKVFGT